MLKVLYVAQQGGGKGNGNIGVMSHSMFSMHKPSGDILMFYVVK